MSREKYRPSGRDRAPLNFRFNGRQLLGRAGDTLAAALLANGVHFVARSFKYHRPRGIMAGGVEEPGAIVAVGSGAEVDTNCQATRVELCEGLEATSINASPSLRWDAGALTGRFSRFLPAGFYYKTLMWPSWHLFEPLIRRMAGLGVTPGHADPSRYEQAYCHCDVLVVGGGPAGIAAACSAARAGADVLLLEQDAALGGALLWETHRIDAMPAAEWLAHRLRELSALPNVRMLTRTTVAGYYDHNLLTAVEQVQGSAQAAGDLTRQRLWHVRAAQVVLATGAHERPAVFPGNDRPGILLASAARFYLGRFGVAVGSRVVVTTNNDDAYRSAQALMTVGIQVVAILDSRAASGARIEGVPVHYGTVITATTGRRRVRSVTAMTLDGAHRTRLACDAVLMSGGWTPAVQLFCQSGGKLQFDAALATFVPAQAAQATHVAGAAAGRLTLDGSLCSGGEAGRAAAAALGLTPAAVESWHADMPESTALEPLWRVPAALAGKAKQWIDFHNDVTDADIALAARENLHSVEHLKRYTTLGMAPDQGKTSNLNGLAVLGELTGRTPPQVGTTTFRPPFAPIAFGAIAGRNRGALFGPLRQLPTHAVQQELGASFDEYGAWTRPACYSRSGETLQDTIAREVRAVRTAVGVMDYSPLGKLAITGPDAAAFLDRLVTTRVATLKPGQCRYSLTLAEGGTLIDDGVIAKLADGTVLMGTTSGAVERIHALLEEWRQCELPTLQVAVADVTAQWAVLLLTGPRARDLLALAGSTIDLSPAAFPHMTVREGSIEGIPLRVQRVSFSGELSYEIALPAGYAPALLRRLLRLGEALGVTPVGLEALDVLRIEKGFFHVGTDTDATTTPDDVGFGAMVRNKPLDFRGRRSLSLPALREPGRLQLVGLAPLDTRSPLAVGAQLLPSGGRRSAAGEGFVSSSIWSPTMGRPLALGLVADGRARSGEQVTVWSERTQRPARIVDPRVYDPEGALLRD